MFNSNGDLVIYNQRAKKEDKHSIAMESKGIMWFYDSKLNAIRIQNDKNNQYLKYSPFRSKILNWSS
jgi:hypothetical protein